MNVPRPTGTSAAFPEFEWFLPSPKKAELAITIPNDRCINFNPRLKSQLPEQITIGVSPDGKILRVKESAGEGYHIPKSGSIKASVLIDNIKARGIRLPARYLVEKANGCWIATVVLPIASPTAPERTPKKPRSSGLSAMLPVGSIRNE